MKTLIKFSLLLTGTLSCFFPLTLIARYTPTTITPNKIPAAYYDPNPGDPSSYYDPNNPNPSKQPLRNDSDEILGLIEGQINAIQSSDLNSAYSDFTGSAFRSETSFDEFKYFITSYPIFTKTKNAYFGGVDIRGNNAMLQGMLSATDGETSKVDYYLVKEGNIWKILGMRLNNAAPYSERHEKAARAYDFQQDIQ